MAISLCVLLLCLWFPGQAQPATAPPAGEVDLQALVMQQAQTIEQLQARLTNVENRLETGGDSEAVAFHARMHHDNDDHAVANGQKIKYSVVTLNEGNGYDNTTGVFTAPVTGIYEFHMKIVQKPPNSVHAHIYQGGHAIAEALASGDSGRDRSATSVVTHVQEGQKVYVQVDSDQAQLSAGMFQNSFSGYLIQED